MEAVQQCYRGVAAVTKEYSSVTRGVEAVTKEYSGVTRGVAAVTNEYSRVTRGVTAVTKQCGRSGTEQCDSVLIVIAGLCYVYSGCCNHHCLY